MSFRSIMCGGLFLYNLSNHSYCGLKLQNMCKNLSNQHFTVIARYDFKKTSFKMCNITVLITRLWEIRLTCLFFLIDRAHNLILHFLLSECINNIRIESFKSKKIMKLWKAIIKSIPTIPNQTILTVQILNRFVCIQY